MGSCLFVVGKGGFVPGQVGGRQARGGVLGHQLAQERRDSRGRLGRRRRRRAGREHAARTVGVLHLVERQERREVDARARVDQMDIRQVPSCDAEPETRQRPVGRRDLEAYTLYRDRAVAAALRARDLHAKRPPERLGARAITTYIGTFEIALDGCLLELAVDRMVILLLHPRLRRGVEQSQGEHRLAFEHGHESALDQGPEVLLFPVLLGRVRQRQILHDTEPLDPLDGLRGFHRRAVVAEQCTRRTSLLDPLRETVDQVRGVLALQVPLRVAAHPRAVIEQAEEIRCLPLPRRRKHLPLALMEVEVPERIDMLVFVRTRLARYHLRLTPLTLAAPPLALAQESMILHEAAHRTIARHRTQRRILLHQDSEVVVMELITPARVLLILARQRRRQRGRDARMRARVLGHLALERAEGVLLSARRVVHALDRLAGEAERLARGRMLPRPPGELVDAAGKLAGLRRRGQQLADDRKAQTRPSQARWRLLVLAHGVLLDERQQVSSPAKDPTSPRKTRKIPSSAGRRAQAVNLRKGDPAGNEPVVSGARNSSTTRTRCCHVPGSLATIDAGNSLVSTPTSRACTATSTAVLRNGPCHHPSHRFVVRAGTPVTRRTDPSVPSACASMLATSTTAPRYTRRPRNRSDGGVARLRQPSRPQHKLNRRTNSSPACAISAPRGLRS